MIETTGKSLWRQDPVHSHSDCCIVIEVIDASSGQVERSDFYNVHKLQLVAGSRGVAYFGTRFRGNSSSILQIRLHELAAIAFPALLDYIYDEAEPLAITSSNATALHYLGQYFGIRDIRAEVVNFVGVDISSRSCGRYYEEACILGDTKMRNIAALVALDRITRGKMIDTSSPFVRLTDVSFWKEVARELGEGTNDEAVASPETISMNFSLLLAEFFKYHSVSGSDFLFLTGADHMPKIHFTVAVKLLDFERRCTQNRTDHVENDGLTSLEKRCIASLSANLYSLDEEDTEQLGLLQQQNPVLLTTLLAATISVAKSTCQKSSNKKQKSVRLVYRPTAPAPKTYRGSRGKGGDLDQTTQHSSRTRDRLQHFAAVC